MIHYEKPIISVDTGMAEGIYAASGAKIVTLGELKINQIYWGESGDLTFTANFSSLAGSKLTLNVTFSSNITGAHGGGSSTSINGNTATFNWGYQAPESATLHIIVDTNLSNIKITGYTYSTQV